MVLESPAEEWPITYTYTYTYTDMSVEILLEHFRRKLLQFEWSKTASNLVRLISRFISLTKLCSSTSLQELHISTPSFTYVEDLQPFFKLNASWIYLDKAAFLDFKIFLLLPHACEDFARINPDRTVKKIVKSLIFAEL